MGAAIGVGEGRDDGGRGPRRGGRAFRALLTYPFRIRPPPSAVGRFGRSACAPKRFFLKKRTALGLEGVEHEQPLVVARRVLLDHPQLALYLPPLPNQHPMQLWPCIVMALYSHGPVWLWPCMVMALHTHGPT